MKDARDEKIVAVGSTLGSIPRRRKILYVLIIWLGFFAVAETGSRIGAYFLYGRSPYFLFYGLSSFMADADPEGHTAAYDGYFKFPANQKLRQYGLFETPTPIQINSHGFRGPDFSAEKRDSVIRVVCLGESSTFGFYDSDGGTYPYLLDRMLNDPTRSSHQQYEVINGGIPHANSDNIRAMLIEEILSYRPDVLTLYAGYNDAALLMAPTRFHRLLIWVHGHFASFVAFKTVVSKLGGPELPSRWSTHVAGTDSSQAEVQVRLHTDRYRRNVEQIIEAAQAHGVRVILILQATTTDWGDTSGITYKQKVDKSLQTLAAGGKISARDSTMVVHSALMDELRSIASEHALDLINFIEVVDRHPEYFASYVHLTEAANAELARMIASTIRPSGPM